MRSVVIAAAFWLLPASAGAQWLDWPTPGIPRTADGKPNLTAPAPRTAEGKPDFSGLWQPEVNPYRFSVIQDLKDAAIFRPAAHAIFMNKVKDLRRDDPVTNCLPGGPADLMSAMYRIVQSPTVIAQLYETGTGRFRQIHMDGRKLPRDPQPTWLGYSIGRWEGDTLVVEYAGFNDRTWLDRVGHPHSERLRVTERFQRVDFGHLFGNCGNRFIHHHVLRGLDDFEFGNASVFFDPHLYKRRNFCSRCDGSGRLDPRAVKTIMQHFAVPAEFRRAASTA